MIVLPITIYNLLLTFTVVLLFLMLVFLKREVNGKEILISYHLGGITNGSAQSQQVMSLMSQVFIGSIFYEVTEQQLRDAFAPFGQIKVVNLNLDPMTGKHKGFAFIWFDIPEAAQLAIEAVSFFVKWKNVKNFKIRWTVPVCGGDRSK